MRTTSRTSAQGRKFARNRGKWEERTPKELNFFPHHEAMRTGQSYEMKAVSKCKCVIPIQTKVGLVKDEASTRQTPQGMMSTTGTTSVHTRALCASEPPPLAPTGRFRCQPPTPCVRPRPHS